MEKVHPARTALVIIDMQNDMLHPEGKTAVGGGRNGSAGWAIVPALQQLLAAARRSGVLVVHVHGETLPKQRSGSGPWLDARTRATFSTPDIVVAGSWGQEAIEEFAPEVGEPVVRKSRYSAIPDTALDLVLRSNRIETLVITGVSTNACVESTARAAFSHDYYVVYVEDCLASWSQPLHDAALESAAHRYAVVQESSAVIGAWTDARVV